MDVDKNKVVDYALKKVGNEMFEANDVQITYLGQCKSCQSD